MNIKKIATAMITPGVLALHWLTQHNAWLYVFGALSLVAIVVCGIGAVALTYMWLESDYDAASSFPIDPPLWERVYGVVCQIGATVYLLWTESWVAVTLYLIATALVWTVIILAKHIRQLAAAERSRRERRWNALFATDVAWRDV